MTHYLDIDEIQAAYGWSTRYIYRLANIHQWRRIRLGRTVRYHWHDVVDTTEKRSHA